MLSVKTTSNTSSSSSNNTSADEDNRSEEDAAGGAELAAMLMSHLGLSSSGYKIILSLTSIYALYNLQYPSNLENEIL
jgi:hypothetical protein